MANSAGYEMPDLEGGDVVQEGFPALLDRPDQLHKTFVGNASFAELILDVIEQISKKGRLLGIEMC